ncbi:TatD family hydrolase [Candidatus Methylacidiphilum infernorum]|uniref:TatD family hydrolase n=1 Tax=Candidatus Methylacidiphilum infernorum TaxID=511746 RepID=A0ABX7PXT4_9BACT|nr:TatD family hydrolase [Candidatus Methylacidiphilum infernorum]QSR87625.1 TatD family hydrolase [Candidatus Methylacidiphilum infernorum]
MFIETHAHLDFPQFAKDLEEVVERAIASGIDKIITIGTNLKSSRRAIGIAEKIPAVWAAVGIHPLEAHEVSKDFEKELLELIDHPKVVALGEMGLDFHKFDPSLGQEQIEARKKRQREVFELQLSLAAQVHLNVIIHQRDAFEETLVVLAPYRDKIKGVFHCFVGGREEAKRIFDQGHLVSFTGIVTFPNAAQLRETLKSVPLDKFMLETDCPFLAPIPHRGKRAEPAHITRIAEEVAKIKNVSIEEVAQYTSLTASSFFAFQK